MEATLMDLKILLPFRIFLETKNVSSVIIETNNGSYGLLPNRLDCVAALVPGIFTYETKEKGIRYVAVDEGLLIKADKQVMVSVRNAIDGADLGKLQELIEKEFTNLDEKEKNMRSVMSKMESRFIQTFEKFRKE